MSTDVDADDSRREKVSDEDYRKIDAKLTELKRRLNDKKGSLIDPQSLLDALQCLIEGREVMPGSTSYSVVDGSSDQRVMPFTSAQWVKLAHLPVMAIGCTVKTLVSLSLAYGSSAHSLGGVLLRTEQEIEENCGAKALKDLSYCLSTQMLRLPTREELDDIAMIWWVEFRTFEPFMRETVSVRVPRNHLGLVPIFEINEISHYWPLKARVEGGVTTLGEVLAFENERALGDFLVSLHPEWEEEMREPQFRHNALKIAEWVSANDLKFAGAL